MNGINIVVSIDLYAMLLCIGSTLLATSAHVRHNVFGASSPREAQAVYEMERPEVLSDASKSPTSAEMKPSGLRRIKLHDHGDSERLLVITCHMQFLCHPVTFQIGESHGAIAIEFADLRSCALLCVCVWVIRHIRSVDPAYEPIQTTGSDLALVDAPLDVSIIRSEDIYLWNVSCLLHRTLTLDDLRLGASLRRAARNAQLVSQEDF